MKNYLFFSFLIFIGFSSCDSSYQYNIYVKNSTKKSIKVVFKSPYDVNGLEERSETLQAGESKRIISTKNIPIDETDGSNNHCSFAADYVKAFQEDKESKTRWCDEDIKFELEDIGQWTFTIDYKPKDF